jgi:hypothetical protein
MAADGILITLEALLVPRAANPVALDEAPAALRRIGWIGRPLVIVGTHLADRQLPVDEDEREAWVRDTLGGGAFAVLLFEPPTSERGTEGVAHGTEQWRSLRDANEASWLVTDTATHVGPAKKGGLKVIVIGPADPDPGAQRPDYQARDLRDAIGHLLAVDVFAAPR